MTRNLSHSCGRYSLRDHFRGKDPALRSMFDSWVSAAREAGPVIVYAQKTRIVFQVRVRFGGAMVWSSWLDATLWLKRKVRHPRLERIEDYGQLGYGLHFRLTHPKDVDARLWALVREAYRVGAGEPRPIGNPRLGRMP